MWPIEVPGRPKEKWGSVLKGKRRSCSAFEMMFKKNIVQAKTVEKAERSVFRLADFRKDLATEDDTILDISAYRCHNKNALPFCKTNFLPEYIWSFMAILGLQ